LRQLSQSQSRKKGCTAHQIHFRTHEGRRGSSVGPAYAPNINRPASNPLRHFIQSRVSGRMPQHAPKSSDLHSVFPRLARRTMFSATQTAIPTSSHTLQAARRLLSKAPGLIGHHVIFVCIGPFGVPSSFCVREQPQPRRATSHRSQLATTSLRVLRTKCIGY